MKVIKSTGLVPVKALVHVANVNPGQIFGLTPDKARKAIEEGAVVAETPPDGVETFDVADPASPNAKLGSKTTKEPKATGDPVVEVPADWRDLHHLRRISIAKAIVAAIGGDSNKTMTAEEADGVIGKELERRAAAKT